MKKNNKKKILNTQISAYYNNTIKHHHLKTIKIIKKLRPSFSGSFLDIGCANGTLNNYLSSVFKNANFEGLDISSKLIKIANSNKLNKNSNFYVRDIDKAKYKKKYDIIHASGMLSNYDNFQPPISKWIKLLNKKGLLIIFGCFNSNNVDTKVKIRNNYKNTDWENGLTTYSINTVSSYLSNKKINHYFYDFKLPINLKKQEDPIRSFTLKTSNGKKIILTGANIVNEFFHLVIHNE